jgi:hypothetical protein
MTLLQEGKVAEATAALGKFNFLGDLSVHHADRSWCLTVLTVDLWSGGTPAVDALGRWR